MFRTINPTLENKDFSDEKAEDSQLKSSAEAIEALLNDFKKQGRGNIKLIPDIHAWIKTILAEKDDARFNEKIDEILQKTEKLIANYDYLTACLIFEILYKTICPFVKNYPGLTRVERISEKNLFELINRGRFSAHFKGQNKDDEESAKQLIQSLIPLIQIDDHHNQYLFLAGSEASCLSSDFKLRLQVYYDFYRLRLPNYDEFYSNDFSEIYGQLNHADFPADLKSLIQHKLALDFLSNRAPKNYGNIAKQKGLELFTALLPRLHEFPVDMQQQMVNAVSATFDAKAEEGPLATLLFELVAGTDKKKAFKAIDRLEGGSLEEMASFYSRLVGRIPHELNFYERMIFIWQEAQTCNAVKSRMINTFKLIGIKAAENRDFNSEDLNAKGVLTPSFAHGIPMDTFSKGKIVSRAWDSRRPHNQSPAPGPASKNKSARFGAGA